jgi:predicted nuclease of predicted toxin-antitoxin system
MRFLADVGISPRTIEFLTHLGHDAVHARTLNLHRSADRSIIEHARADSQTILTFDLDFGDILALGVMDRPSVIIFRLSDERPTAVNQRLSAVLHEQREALDVGALILVEDSRYRMRRLPIRPG